MFFRSKFPNLKSDQVHIWSASLVENEKDTDFFTSILSEDERERSKSLRFSKDRNQFVVTRGILRCLLAKYLKQTPTSIEIMYGLWGKPCLLQDQNLHFNVTHSRDYALYAITQNYEVGIDLEYIDENIAFEDIAPTIFSMSELTFWKNLNLEDRINTFFRRWVYTEAFLKASGKGWLNDKQELISDLKDDFKNMNIADEIRNPYYFEFLQGYVSALFVEGALLHPLFYTWNQSNVE